MFMVLVKINPHSTQCATSRAEISLIMRQTSRVIRFIYGS